MSDVNRKIIVDVEDNASSKLDNIQNSLGGLNQNQTKVVQSTKNLTKETNALNEGLLRNGGAMGLLSAATGGLAMDFKDAIEAIELTGVSLKGLRGAIIATGIGALAIVVLELVTNWEKWKGVIDGTTDAMNKLNGQLAINNNKREESNAITQSSISVLTEELRLLTAQGATKDILIAKENQISEAKARQAQIDIASYQTSIDQINALIAKDEEYLSLKQELFNLQNGATNKNLVDLVDEIELVKGQIAQYERTNQLFKDRKDLTDKLNGAQLVLNASVNDPKVRAAEAQKAKIDADRAKALELQKKLQDAINNSLQKGLASAKTLNDINASLNNISSVDLTQTYSKFRQFIDTFNQLRDAAKKTEKSISELQGRQLNDKQKAQLTELENSLKTYNESITLLRKNFTELARQNDINNLTWDTQVIELQKLSDMYDLLNSKIMEYEKVGFGDYQSKTSENIDLINEKLLQQNRILQKQFDIESKTRNQRSNALQKEMEDIQTRQSLLATQQVEATITDKNGNSVKQIMQLGEAADRIKKELVKGADGLKYTFSDSTDVLINQYLEFQNKIRDIRTQLFDVAKEEADSREMLDLESNKLFLTSLIEQERMAYEARYSAQEDYYNATQTLASNTFGFLSQLQDETLIKDKDVRNALLVAQKGAEIAQVVIGTVRENSKLKMQAAEYSGNATLYAALGIANSVINPVASASYLGASSAYAAGAAKSTAQIPINWGIAGVSIASILATTLTSWNRSDSGGGSSAGGGGGGTAPQFNIVGTNTNNQLAASIAAQQNQPINAYVVGSHVSTQQALDRNRVNTATFLSVIQFISIWTSLFYFI